MAGRGRTGGGVAIALVGVRLHSGLLLFVGTVIAGLAFGAAFNGSIRRLVSLARPRERAGLMPGFLIVSYLAFSLPAIVAGLLVGYFGLRLTNTAYGFALVFMAASSWIALKIRPPRQRAAH